MQLPGLLVHSLYKSSTQPINLIYWFVGYCTQDKYFVDTRPKKNWIAYQFVLSTSRYGTKLQFLRLDRILSGHPENRHSLADYKENAGVT